MVDNTKKMENEKISKMVIEDINEEKVKYEWEEAERSFQKKDRDFWITAIAILILVSVILVFVKEFFLIITLVSILFLYYVLSTIPPGSVKYKITNRAIYFGEQRYEWNTLTRFWFGKSLSSEMVHFETDLKFPRQISLVISPMDKEKIKEIVVKKIPLIEDSPKFVDKMTKWLVNKFPLEKRETEKKA